MNAGRAGPKDAESTAPSNAQGKLRDRKDMLCREFGHAVNDVAGGSVHVSKMGKSPSAAGRPGRPHVLMKLGSTEHADRLFAAGRIEVRGKTYEVARPGDVDPVGRGSRSSTGSTPAKGAQGGHPRVEGRTQTDGRVSSGEGRGVAWKPSRSLQSLTLFSAEGGVEALV